MTEPISPSAVVVGGLGGGLVGVLASVNADAAVGSLCGALIYFIVAKELPLPTRLVCFLISFVMGYLFAPALAKAQIMGIGPIEFPGPAAFISAALVVTATMAAIRSRGRAAPREG
ncbi:phage holin family protein [Pseudomonas aeruginosa]|uniref:putative holin n=1 Tax=Pseudomonas aeruginosa TaxID=287 RepID=UPI0005BC013F|nr:putative holin [Pseudomonas aeruginosa]KQJ65373.1 hypothetical protein AN400_07370 [Pseudomonas aeruginosa]MCV4361547.1 phage holin family protein [Pseudomonas aeruginosa]HEJ1861527.1 hypothetical protein [Pseudomonas aeruginosa]